MSKQPPPAASASVVGPCPTITQIVGRHGTGSLPRTIAPPDHPRQHRRMVQNNSRSEATMSSVTHPLQHFSRTDHV